eukprot:TRINITY_DN5564_c0_g1_i1.p1 TRINITY_DN5564_c0_g1~~TRINITY_DN5564_c0_g1_i1.p1  ORF type:complete len:580 (+),score=133.14 TRINITY_DN5564_c0_g1_i1:71-1810(+)
MSDPKPAAVAPATTQAQSMQTAQKTPSTQTARAATQPVKTTAQPQATTAVPSQTMSNVVQHQPGTILMSGVRGAPVYTTIRPRYPQGVAQTYTMAPRTATTMTTVRGAYGQPVSYASPYGYSTSTVLHPGPYGMVATMRPVTYATSTQRPLTTNTLPITTTTLPRSVVSSTATATSSTAAAATSTAAQPTTTAAKEAKRKPSTETKKPASKKGHKASKDHKANTRKSAHKPAKKLAQPSKGSSIKQQAVLKLKATKFSWTALDDFRLIANVEQTQDLVMVHQGVKFSKEFTLKQVMRRWYALLYEEDVGRLASAAMSGLDAATREQALQDLLFSPIEDELLIRHSATLDTEQLPSEKDLEQLLKAHVSIFHPIRTPATLRAHYIHLAEFGFMPKHAAVHASKQREHLELLQRDVLDPSVATSISANVLRELDRLEAKTNRKIRRLEHQLATWACSGVVPPDSVVGLPDDTLAVFKGRVLHYAMKTVEVVLGRSSQDGAVDIDMSLEGPATRVSRWQATIKLKHDGNFYIHNQGKRYIEVNGVIVFPGKKRMLDYNSVIDVCGIALTFRANEPLIADLTA